MPIILHKEISSSAKLVVWEITEDFHKLSGQLHPLDLKEIGELLLENKKLETAATRLAVAHLVNSFGVNYEGFHKDDFGKPHIPNNKNIHISISHSYPFAGAIIDTVESTGIDIEMPGELIKRIKHKFLSDQELAFCGNDLELLTQAWCAKEVLYKIHGRTQLSFRNQLKVIIKSDEHIVGVIRIDGVQETYELRSTFLKGHCLVFKQ